MKIKSICHLLVATTFMVSLTNAHADLYSAGVGIGGIYSYYDTTSSIQSNEPISLSVTRERGFAQAEVGPGYISLSGNATHSAPYPQPTSYVWPGSNASLNDVLHIENYTGEGRVGITFTLSRFVFATATEVANSTSAGSSLRLYIPGAVDSTWQYDVTASVYGGTHTTNTIPLALDTPLTAWLYFTNNNGSSTK